MKKKILLLALCMALVCSLFAARGFAPAASADDPVVRESGGCGDYASWTIYVNDVLVIAGRGEITGSWGDYKDYFNTVIFVPDPEYPNLGVTNIPSNAFVGCENLSSVTLPATLQEIGGYAFSGCDALESITLPDGVTEMSPVAFSGFDGRVYAAIGSATAQTLSANEYYFYTAGNENVRLRYTFSDEDGSVTGLTASAHNNEITTAVIPDGVTEIRYSGFFDCQALQSVEMADSVTRIGNNAFLSCKSLASIALPEAITAIENYAFTSCTALASLTLPDGVTEIGFAAFTDPTRLYATPNSDTAKTLSVGEYDFCLPGYESVRLRHTLTDGEITGLAASAYNKEITTAVIPDGVTEIKYDGFFDCATLQSVEMADSVTRLGNNAFMSCTALTSMTLSENLAAIGNNAFINCPALSSLTLPDGVTEMASDSVTGTIRLYATPNSATAKTLSSSKYYFYLPGYENVKLQHALTDGEITGLTASAHNKEITTAVIPDGVTEIKYDGFFNCQALQSVEMADSVTRLGSNAFMSCTSLTSMTLSENLAAIGNNAFIDCPALSSLTLPDGVTEMASDSVTETIRLYATPGSATAKTLSSSKYYFYLPGYESVKLQHALTDGEITGLKAKASSTAITAAVVPSGVTELEYSAFYNCASLASVTLPDSLTTLGSSVFGGCTALEAVTLPDEITSANNSFSGYSGRVYASFGSVTAVTLSNAGKYFYVDGHENVQLRHMLTNGEITATKAKADSTAITTAAVPDGVTELEYQAFYNCAALESVTLPDSLTSIGGSAFYNCASLASVTLPDSLTALGSSVFGGCTALEAVTLPDGITSVNNSFSGYSGRVYASFGSVTAVTLSNAGKYFYVDGYENVQLRHMLTNGEITATKAKTHSTAITTAAVPDGVTELEYQAFYNCAALESVMLPDSLTSIGGSAFYNCAALESVTIPASVTSIGSSAFPKANETLSVYCGSYALSWAQSNKYKADTDPEHGTYCYALLHVWGEAGYVWAADNAAVTATRVCVDASHVETETVAAEMALTKSPTETEAGEHTWTSLPFENAAFAAQVKILADVPALGTLTGLKLPNRLREIGTEAFMDDEALQYVLIPESCTAIGERAFANCSGLLYIRIPASVVTIAGDAFDGCGAGLVIDRLG